MKRIFINTLCVGMLFSGAKIFAQNKLKLGLDAGYTNTSLEANLSNLIDAKYESRYGFGINFSAELSIWKSLFASTGISYLQKNYKYERINYRSGWYTEYNNDFLSLPLLIGAYIFNDPNESNGFWLKVAGGMYTEYWLSMKTNGQYPVFAELQQNGEYNYTTHSTKYDWKSNENQLKRFGYGLQGQAQAGYSINKIDVYASFNYQHGLSGINKKSSVDDYKRTTNMYMLSLGVAYKFN